MCLAKWLKPFILFGQGVWWAMLISVATIFYHNSITSFIVTPQIQVFAYLMETDTQFWALNKWQHPHKTVETKDNKQQTGLLMAGFISPQGMYFLCRVTCWTDIPLCWLKWPALTIWFADLPSTATGQSLYGHRRLTLISENNALVFSAFESISWLVIFTFLSASRDVCFKT